VIDERSGAEDRSAYIAPRRRPRATQQRLAANVQAPCGVDGAESRCPSAPECPSASCSYLNTKRLPGIMFSTSLPMFHRLRVVN